MKYKINTYPHQQIYKYKVYFKSRLGKERFLNVAAENEGQARRFFHQKRLLKTEITKVEPVQF